MKRLLRALAPRLAGAPPIDVKKSAAELIEAKRWHEEMIAKLPPEEQARAREVFAQVVAEGARIG